MPPQFDLKLLCSGYMSPEYAMDGVFSVKSDVYSFGVLLLEIISGQKNKGAFYSESHHYLLGRVSMNNSFMHARVYFGMSYTVYTSLFQAWTLWNERRYHELVDPSISLSFPASEAMRFANIGLLCVQECPEHRPTMQSVVFMIESPDSGLLKPNRPGFMSRGVSSEPSPHSTNELSSVQDVTVSVIAGR